MSTSTDTKTFVFLLARASRLIAVVLWIVVAITVPASLLLRSYSSGLLMLAVALSWQILSSLLWPLAPPKAPRARLRLRYRLTPWGLVYCGIAITFCLLSVHWGINLIYLTAAFLLGSAICAAALPGLSLRRTCAQWNVPDRVFAGDLFSVEVALRNPKGVRVGLSAFALRVGTDRGNGAASAAYHTIPRLAPGQEHGLTLRQYMPERGRHRLPPLRVSTRFPFGVLEASTEMRAERATLVLPRLGHIHQHALIRQTGGEAKWVQELARKEQEGEFRSLREYQHGDNPRHIHWATSARLHKLYVREFERREMHSVLLLLDAYAPEEDPREAQARSERFETAVSFAATLGALLTERNVFYAFAAYCSGLNSLPYDTGHGHLFSLLETLALAKTTSQHTLADLAGTLGFHQVGTGGICVVTPGPLTQEQRAAALGPLAQVSIWIDVSESGFHDIFSP